MSIADLKVRISGNADQFDSAMKKMQKNFNRTVRKMERAGKSMTRNITLPIAAMAGAAAKASIDFESAFAGVRKTVDATETEFAGLRKGILDMSKQLPTSANEIAGVAEAAGQLGIQTENILEFSRTMVMLGDTTNMAAQEAATSLARIANVMQLPQDQFDEMGSTIVELGNNFATTEAEITNFSQRIAGAGKVAGLAGSDIFGIGAALTSVGIRAEAGGTAVQKALLNINDAVARGTEELEVFASTAGMSAENFQVLWREDAGKAFTEFVNGLGRQGDQATATLESVGLNSERVRTTFLSLAGAGDLLNRTMESGEKAWKENTALTEEAQQRYRTLMSRLEMLKNRFVALGVEIGDSLTPHIEYMIEVISGAVATFEDMSATTKSWMLTVAGLAAAAGPIALLTSKLIQAAQAMKALTISMVTNPFTAVAAAITAIGAAAISTEMKIKSFHASVDRMLEQGMTGQSIDKVNEKIVEVAERIEELEKVEKMFGGRNRELPKLREQLDELVDLRNDLASKEIQEIISKRAEEQAENTTEQFKNISGWIDRLEARKPKLEIQVPTDKVIPALDMIGSKFRELSSDEILEDDGKFDFGEKILPPGSVGKLQERISQLQENIKFAFDPEQISTYQAKIEGLQERIAELTGKTFDLSQAEQFAKSVALDFTNSFGQGMANVIVQGEKLVDTLRNIGKLLASAVIQKGLSILLTGGLSGEGFFGSGGGIFGAIFGRDIGGPAMAGQPYLIGQGQHQELFIPDRSGSVVPNSKMRGMGGGRFNATVNVPVYLDSRKIYEGQVQVNNDLSR